MIKSLCSILTNENSKLGFRRIKEGTSIIALSLSKILSVLSHLVRMITQFSRTENNILHVLVVNSVSNMKNRQGCS